LQEVLGVVADNRFTLDLLVPVFLTEWRVSMMASAASKTGVPELADRTEFVIRGLELSDGFPWIGNGSKQKALFDEALDLRRSAGKPQVVLDDRCDSAPDVSLFDEVTSGPLELIDFPGTDRPPSVVSGRASPSCRGAVPGHPSRCWHGPWGRPFDDESPCSVQHPRRDGFGVG